MIPNNLDIWEQDMVSKCWFKVDQDMLEFVVGNQKKTIEDQTRVINYLYRKDQIRDAVINAREKELTYLRSRVFILEQENTEQKHDLLIQSEAINILEERQRDYIEVMHFKDIQDAIEPYLSMTFSEITTKRKFYIINNFLRDTENATLLRSILGDHTDLYSEYNRLRKRRNGIMHG